MAAAPLALALPAQVSSVEDDAELLKAFFRPEDVDDDFELKLLWAVTESARGFLPGLGGAA
jgi:hypothetical protein